MSKEDQEEINNAIYKYAVWLNRYVSDVNQKIEELVEHVNGAKSDDDIKALMELKKNHVLVIKIFEEFKLQFCEPDGLVILTNIKMDIKDFIPTVTGFMYIEDRMNYKCNELMIKFSESGVRPAGSEEGSSILKQRFERLKIQLEDYDFSLEWVKELGYSEQNKIEEGSDIGGQGEDVSDSKSTELPIERIKKPEDYVSETSKSGEEGGSDSMKGLKIPEDYVENKINDGSDVGGQRQDVSDSKSTELGLGRFKKQEDYVSETSKSVGEGGSVSMEGLKIPEDYVENKIKDGSDIGGQREDVSDSKSTELRIKRFKKHEDYVFEKSKSGEEGGSVSMEGLKILLEDYVENKINDDSDIGGQREDVSDSKSTELRIERFKIQEENMDQRSNELAPEFDRSDHDSDVNLEKSTESSTSKYCGACTNIEGLEQKISRLISETELLFKEEEDIEPRKKEDEDNEKKSLNDCIKILQATKDRAMEFGTKLCFQLVDLRFIISEREELMENFQKFKSWLESYVILNKNCVEIKLIIEVLKLADGEMIKLKESQKVKKEKLEETKVNVSEVKEGLIEVSQIDDLLVLIVQVVLYLEFVLMHPRTTDLQLLTRDVICLKELKAIDTKIDELKESSTVIFGSEEMKRVEFNTRALQGRIKEMWNQSGESLEENVLRND